MRLEQKVSKLMKMHKGKKRYNGLVEVNSLKSSIKYTLGYYKENQIQDFTVTAAPSGLESELTERTTAGEDGLGPIASKFNEESITKDYRVDGYLYMINRVLIHYDCSYTMKRGITICN